MNEKKKPNPGFYNRGILKNKKPYRVGYRDIANEIGLSVGTVQEVFNGTASKLESVLKVAEYLKVDALQLFDVKGRLSFDADGRLLAISGERLVSGYSSAEFQKELGKQSDRYDALILRLEEHSKNDWSAVERRFGERVRLQRIYNANQAMQTALDTLGGEHVEPTTPKKAVRSNAKKK